MSQCPADKQHSGIDGARGLKVGYTKNRTVRRLFTSAIHARVWCGVWSPPFPGKKIRFGIGRDAVSRCLEGLTCTLQSLLSRYSITFSIPPPPRPTVSMQIWTNYETYIFKKWGGTYLPNPVSPPVMCMSVCLSVCVS